MKDLYLIANNKLGSMLIQRVDCVEKAESILKGFESFGGENNEFPKAAVFDMNIPEVVATLRIP